jgi:hypothetical protein
MEANIENKYIGAAKKKDHSSAWGMGALAGIVFGLASLFIGLLLWVISDVEQISFHGVDSLLLGASFILLLIGSHFLDVARRDIKKKKKKNLNL